ncbi:phosphate uptake regulator PhoU [Candidatus Woesearchaeota archaeon]|nr:phosphate uptake regulator PhoU [Candidatus Woesearchaeota archaeon]
MKRKVIQIAGSTQLVSLPRSWSKRHSIQKGEELDVQEDGNRVIISNSARPQVEKAEFNADEFSNMVVRAIGAFYRRGVDELKINFTNPKVLDQISYELSKETSGFEVLEQGKNYCVVKYVGGSIEEFDLILRRTFLLLNTMAEETAEAIKNGEFDRINNIASLEEANNRFTSICRRYLNKGGSTNYSKIGPLYHIIQELENIADEYKYICQHFAHLKNKKVKLDKQAVDTFMLANSTIRKFYELFYKFDKQKILELREIRTKVVERGHDVYKKNLCYADYWLAHHSLIISNLVFGLTGAYMILFLEEKGSQ